MAGGVAAGRHSRRRRARLTEAASASDRFETPDGDRTSIGPWLGRSRESRRQKPRQQSTFSHQRIETSGDERKTDHVADFFTAFVNDAG
jgi:hypothetical protein